MNLPLVLSLAALALSLVSLAVSVLVAATAPRDPFGARKPDEEDDPWTP